MALASTTRSVKPLLLLLLFITAAVSQATESTEKSSTVSNAEEKSKSSEETTATSSENTLPSGNPDEDLNKLADDLGRPVDEVKKMQGLIHDIHDEEDKLAHRKPSSEKKTGIDSVAFDGDMILPPKILQSILADLKDLEEGNRKKRSYVNFDRYPLSKFDVVHPIVYTFSDRGTGAHSEAEKNVIRKALQHWADHTCLQFTEKPYNHNRMPYTQYLRFMKRGKSCAADVGRKTHGPNDIYLHEGCMFMLGIPVHEIGHAFGIYHEHARYDRDSYITVNEDKVRSGQLSQFFRWPQRENNLYGKRYDYESVMHYPQFAFHKVNKGTIAFTNKATIVPNDKALVSTIGQRITASVTDFEGFNNVYCKAACGNVPRPRCENGGVQNKNTCNTCMCHPGFEGDRCERLAQAKNAQCGGEVDLQRRGEDYIRSPNAGDPSRYPYDTSCTWKFRAPAGYRVRLTFQGRFGIMCAGSGDCMSHYVSVKYRDDKVKPGAKYCCYHHSGAAIVSEREEMIVMWRAHPMFFGKQSTRADNYGFQARVTYERSNSPSGPQRPINEGSASNDVPQDVEPAGRRDPPTTSTTTRRTSTTTRRTSPTTRRTRRTTSTTTTSTTTRPTTFTTTTQQVHVADTSCGFCSRRAMFGFKEQPCRRDVVAKCTNHAQNSDASFSKSTYDCSRTEDYCCQDAFLEEQGDGTNLCRVAHWSGWSTWSSCSRQCGGCGVQTRTREGQWYDKVYQSESQECNTRGCSVDDKPEFCKFIPSIPLCSRPMAACCSGYEPRGRTCYKRQ